MTFLKKEGLSSDICFEKLIILIKKLETFKTRGLFVVSIRRN